MKRTQRKTRFRDKRTKNFARELETLDLAERDVGSPPKEKANTDKSITPKKMTRSTEKGILL